MNNASINAVYNYFYDYTPGRSVQFVDVDTREVVTVDDMEAVKTSLEQGKKLAVVASLNGVTEKFAMITKDTYNANKPEFNCTVSDVYNTESKPFAKKPNGFVRFFHRINKAFGGKGIKSCNDYEASQQMIERVNNELNDRTGDTKFTVPSMLKYEKEEKEDEYDYRLDYQKALDKDLDEVQKVNDEPVKTEAIKSSAPSVEEIKPAPKKLSRPTEKSTGSEAYEYYKDLYERMINDEEASISGGDYFGPSFKEAFPEIADIDSVNMHGNERYVRDVFMESVRCMRDACELCRDKEKGNNYRNNSYDSGIGHLWGHSLGAIRLGQLTAFAISQDNDNFMKHIDYCSKHLPETLGEGKFDWNPTTEELQGMFGAKGAMNINRTNVQILKNSTQKDYVVDTDPSLVQNAPEMSAEL